MVLQGTFSFPGIIAYEDFSFTELSGITPATATAQCYPQDDPPDANGDIVLRYGGNTIILKDMHVDAVMYHAGSGGKICTVRFLDERWAWSFYYITGRYNLRLPNGLVDPNREKTPQELATILFEAMNVDRFDVSALPNDARPDCDWDQANAAQELAKICDDLGCRIVPVRSTGSWKIVVTGEGADLPDNLPYQDAGAGIDPKETPDFIKVVTAPIRYQVQLQMKACGRDTDHSWKDITELSYKPTDQPSGWDNEFGAEFGFDHEMMTRVDGIRTVQPDGTAKSPREFAMESVFRCWRVHDQPENVPNRTRDGVRQFYLPGYNDFVSRRQLLLTNELVQSYTDERDVDHKIPAYMTGAFYSELVTGGMNEAGTRIDKQNREPYGAADPVSFNMAVDHLDTDRTIITTSKQMLTYWPTTADEDRSAFGAAILFLTCAVQVRDPNTWQPVRYEKLLHIGNGTNQDFCHVMIKEDIQPWFITTYNSRGRPLRIQNNQTEVNQMCDYYLNAYAKTFETVASQTRTYIGLFQIDMDGAISQISYRISKSGSDTVVSRGTEHDFDIPTHEQRLQRIATKSSAELARYEKYRSERRTVLLGTSNTL